MKKNIKIIILLLASILSIFAVIYFVNNKNSKSLQNETKQYKEHINMNKISGWIAYWDLNVDNELNVLKDSINSISYFGADFDNKNNVIIHQEIINYYNKTKNNNYKKYITIVNDKKNKDGKYSIKDTELLTSLFSNNTTMDSHINEIINLALQYKFDGIEIDYEAIKNNMDLWNKYLVFIDKLYAKCNENNLKLRVVLEPNTPIEKLNFINGPTYVMMCYNLHYGSSEPGEKSNSEFIVQLINKMKDIPGNKSFAVATGGFDWPVNGKTQSLTERQAKQLQKKYDSDEKRDEKSKCLVFEYTDENNIKHEVWYADKITLNSWINVINENGYEASIWRFGGNLF